MRTKNPSRIGVGCQPTMNRGNTSGVRLHAAQDSITEHFLEITVKFHDLVRKKTSFRDSSQLSKKENFYVFDRIAVLLCFLGNEQIESKRVKDTKRRYLHKRPSANNGSHKLRSMIELGVAIYILYK
jgi:hypothetical protein